MPAKVAYYASSTALFLAKIMLVFPIHATFFLNFAFQKPGQMSPRNTFSLIRILHFTVVDCGERFLAIVDGSGASFIL